MAQEDFMEEGRIEIQEDSIIETQQAKQILASNKPRFKMVYRQQPPPPQQEEAPQQPQPQIIFKSTVTEAPKGVEQAMAVADKVTGEAFGQAMVYTVQADDEMQDKLLSTAKQVIHDKTDSIADMAQTERKAKFFDKNADACQYFGYEEKTTAKFHVKAMAFWAFILNSIYIFTLGYFVVAPISFILTKIKVVVKKTWLAFLFALIAYLVIVGLPILITWLTKVKTTIG